MNLNQSSLISTCRTLSKCVCMDFADVFLTCAAHSICFTVLLWGAELASPPLARPSLRWIRTRFSPLKSFHKRCRGCCAGEVLLPLNVWGYKCSGLFFLTVSTMVIFLFRSFWLSSIRSTHNVNFSCVFVVCK